MIPGCTLLEFALVTIHQMTRYRRHLVCYVRRALTYSFLLVIIHRVLCGVIVLMVSTVVKRTDGFLNRYCRLGWHAIIYLYYLHNLHLYLSLFIFNGLICVKRIDGFLSRYCRLGWHVIYFYLTRGFVYFQWYLLLKELMCFE